MSIAFRHRYPKESHVMGFPISIIAQALVHTVEVHMDYYARFAQDTTSEIYNKANQVVA